VLASKHGPISLPLINNSVALAFHHNIKYSPALERYTEVSHSDISLFVGTDPGGVNDITLKIDTPSMVGGDHAHGVSLDVDQGTVVDEEVKGVLETELGSTWLVFWKEGAGGKFSSMLEDEIVNTVVLAKLLLIRPYGHLGHAIQEIADSVNRGAFLDKRFVFHT